MLEYVPARFKVIRQIRPKLSCSGCERIVQEPAPSRPIDRGLAGPELLAHVLVSKYAHHLPLYRQTDIYEREGVELDRSTLADWAGGASRVLALLVEAVRRYVLEAGTLHGDDIPCRCWRRAMARRKPDACGRMFETIFQQEIQPLRPYGSPIPPIARENIHRSI
jgi:transposase